MASLDNYRIGFIGLGLMGRPMCLNLHRAGARLVIYNRSRAVVDNLIREAIEPADNPADVACRTEIVVLAVSDTPAVKQVLFGDNGLADGLRPGALVIDMGTTAVAATREYAARLAQTGVDFIDAPVSGGEIGARDGSLAIMAGGSEAAVKRAWPLFDILGKSTIHVGDVGAGQVAKAANQVIVGLNIGALAEALALAECAGVDPSKVRQALLGGFAASRILEVHGQRMIDSSFAPGGKVTTQHKDLSQALDLAASLGLSLPATHLNMTLYQRLIDKGEGGLDHSALIRLFRKEND
ncbi:MAG: NAD-binding protein [Chromatiaceae bacterium]|nr:NAD-binding protein [Chromatiaceae bacterium]MCP5409957.1 NAD-binding protein [Chromatiaceae bacterium]